MQSLIQPEGTKAIRYLCVACPFPCEVKEYHLDTVKEPEAPKHCQRYPSRTPVWVKIA